MVNGHVEISMGDKTRAKKVTLSHCFAMASHEVTVVQFQKFRTDQKPDADYSPQSNCPMNRVSWYDAVAYYNWLSDQEGIPQDQWCYEPNDQREYSSGVKIAADYLERSGYRLPTDEEWEFVCRANSTGGYGFGEPLELLTRYAWYNINSKNQMWPVGTNLPNGLGVFDMHGNAREWCHNLYRVPKGQPDLGAKAEDRRSLNNGGHP